MTGPQNPSDPQGWQPYPGGQPPQPPTVPPSDAPASAARSPWRIPLIVAGALLAVLVVAAGVLALTPLGHGGGFGDRKQEREVAQVYEDFGKYMSAGQYSKAVDQFCGGSQARKQFEDMGLTRDINDALGDLGKDLGIDIGGLAEKVSPNMTIDVKKVTIDGDTATVDADMVLGGQTMPSPSETASKVDGKWCMN
ncbi:MAG: hypothetical protein QM774_14060 [Gordonia sp. (in: high G+C Gram-positive bacteria)]|uniref:hypothetical protein n=1 Tax=Gordonia sp. (in: high G+C Gram-positive bacteria) TaxID=84139 RepID=UPI0039E22969